MESIGDAGRVHGINVQDLINDLNKYFEDQENYFIFLALGCMFSNVFDIIHAYSLMYSHELFTQSYLMSLVVQNISLYLAFKYIDKERFNYKNIILMYAIFIIFLILILFKFSYLIKCVEYGKPTVFYLIITVINMVISVKGYRTLKNKKHFIVEETYNYINIAFICNIIYIILAVVVTTKYIDNITLKIITHNVLTIYIYCIYKSIVKESLILPYINIINLNQELNSKSHLLEDTNVHFEKINFIRNKMKENLVKREALLNSILETTNPALVNDFCFPLLPDKITASIVSP